MAVSIASLPPVPAHFLGRNDELAWLDERWAEPNTGMVSVVAFGGVGKSSLVADWTKKLIDAGGRGAQRVFGHSFHSQGSREDAVASSDEFIDRALRFFGDEDPTSGGPWGKGERLAKLVRQNRALLVLDGLEPLQAPPTSGDQGKLRDPALQALVRELAASNPGLCVISTREKVADIPSAPALALTHLSEEAGAALLEVLGVHGPVDERKSASREVQGHGLALTLLGSYLCRACDGDVRRRSEVKLADADDVQGGHAFKIMESYVRWFGESTEVAILRLLGLFNRPAESGCIKALRAEPSIEGLTEPLVNLSEAQWKLTLSTLVGCGLIAKAHPETMNAPLDAHPLVREYFAKQLAEDFPEAAKEAHRRLYEYLKGVAPYRPDTLLEMMPLYHAIAHGCASDAHMDACINVYETRILRNGERFYSLRKFGSYGADLAAVGCFFEQRWDRASSKLTKEKAGWILNVSGYLLRAVGRLQEAMEPMVAGLREDLKRRDFRNAGIAVANVSELQLWLGELSLAISAGEWSVELAEQSNIAIERSLDRLALANSLQQAGKLMPAYVAYREAELIEADLYPGRPTLCSAGGFHYYELLLEADETLRSIVTGVRQQGVTDETAQTSILRRVESALEWKDKESLDTLSIGLYNILIGKIQSSLEFECSGVNNTRSRNSEMDNSRRFFDEGVARLRKAAHQVFLPYGLLARSKFLREYVDRPTADLDLAEAESIAERGSMLLLQVDAALERCRWHLAQGDRKSAHESLELAKALVKKTERPYVPHVPTWEGWKPLVYEGVRYDNVFKEGEIVGYHRRNPEIAALERELGGAVQ